MFWERKSNFKYILFVSVACLLLFIISKMQSVAILAFACFVIACSLTPAVDRLSEKISRSLASILVIIGTVFVALLLLVPIISVSVQEIQRLISEIPSYVKDLITFLSNKTLMGKALIEYINIDIISDTSTKFASTVFNKSVDFTMGFLEVITVILTISVIVYYMLNEKCLVKNAIILMFPVKFKERAQEVYEAIETKVGGYVTAQILSMATVAVFTALGLMALKIDYAVLLGLTAGICDIVPIVGPTLALVAGVICAFSKGPLVVILTILVYLCGQWISNNFVRPLVFGKFLNLHPVIIIFSFLIAAQFSNVWGVILAPAAAATVLTVFDELYIKTINENKHEEIKK